MRDLTRRGLLGGLLATSGMAAAQTGRARGFEPGFRFLTSGPGTLGSIDANGWSAQWASGTPPTFAPDTAPQTLTVLRQGFDATGAAMTAIDTRTITTRVRQAYPNQASFTAATVALDDYVYSTDTIAGVTNNSTEASPKPIAAWAMPDRLLVGNSIAWEIVAFHRDFRANRMVACVQVQATDGTTTTAWQTVSTTAISSLCEDANPIEVYRGTLDISALATGVVTLRARVFPWIGGAASVLDSADQSVAREFSPRYFLKNVARAAAPPIAYVNASTGNDTTGAWDSNDATAYSKPFATMAGVLNAADNATRGILASFPGGMALGMLDGARLRVSTSVTGAAPTVARKQTLAALVVERDPRVTRAAAIVSGAFRPKLSTSLATEAGSEGAILFYDVSISRGSSQFAGETGVALRLMLWNVALTTSSNVTLISNSHCYAYGVAVSGATKTFSQQGAGQENRIIRGCTFDAAATAVEVWWNLGNTITNAALADSRDPTKGGIWYGNRWPSVTAINGMVSGMLGGTAVNQVAVVQNVIEVIHTTTTAVSLGISNDGGSANTNHVVIAYNTATGYGPTGRWNVFYDEASGTTRRTHRLNKVVGNVTSQLNVKGDVFYASTSASEAPNRTGHFPFIHGVGTQGNLALYRTNSGVSEGQLYAGLRSEIGTNPDVALYAASTIWTDYKGTTGSGGTPTAGAGGGTYTLVSGSPARGKVLAPGLAYDLAGLTRPTSNDSAGAYR